MVGIVSIQGVGNPTERYLKLLSGPNKLKSLSFGATCALNPSQPPQSACFRLAENLSYVPFCIICTLPATFSHKFPLPPPRYNLRLDTYLQSSEVVHKRCFDICLRLQGVIHNRRVAKVPAPVLLGNVRDTEKFTRRRNHSATACDRMASG